MPPPKFASKANSPASFAATTERPRPTCVINALAGLGFSCLGNVPAQAGKPSRSLPLATATGLIGKLSDVLGAVWDSSSICPSKERQASGRLCPASMHKRDLDSNPQYLCLRASARTYRRLSPALPKNWFARRRGDAEVLRSGRGEAVPMPSAVRLNNSQPDSPIVSNCSAAPRPRVSA